MQDTNAEPATAQAAESAPDTGAVNFPTFASVKLKRPLKRGSTEISSISLIAPDSGQLRGLSLVAVARLEVDTIATLVSRISRPNVTADEYTRMDPRDMLAIGGEIAGFFED